MSRADLPSLWMVVRASGTVALVLLTATVVMGLRVKGEHGSSVPRFLVVHVHRGVSLLGVVLLVAHVVAAVALLHLSVVPSLLPFASRTRRLYLGLGVLSADLMVAVAVTSVLRRRIGLRRWRHVHALAYVSWAAAMVHGAAPGTDVGVSWVRYLDIICVAVVLLAGGVRLARLQRLRPVRLVVWRAAAALALVGFSSWVAASDSPAPFGDQVSSARARAVSVAYR